MKPFLWTWLLAGGLAASLAWNVRGAWCAAPAAPGGCAETAASCRIDLAELGLSAEQRRGLERRGAEVYAEAERLAERAGELQAQVCERLAAPTVDVAAVRDLAREIGDLRRRSVEACIDSVLEVRTLLGAEQVERLFAACGVSCAKKD